MENQKGRSSFLPILALVKKNIIGAFESISKSNVFRFRLDNDKVFYSYFAKVEQKLDRLIQSIVDLPKIEMKDSPASINIQTMGKETINKIVNELAGLREIVKQSKITLPQTQYIKGKVEVSNQQYVPYDRMLSTLKSIEQKIGNIRVEVPKQEQKEIKLPEYPKEMQVPQMARVIDAIKELRDEIKKTKIKIPEIEFPSSISVNNFPPQKYPMPVTSVNINPLRGFVHTTAVTVTTSLTVLPPEVLSNRRSVIIFNNSAATTVFIGGSEMSASDGLPVLAQAYSPALDAGPKMILYGMTSSGSAEARIMEVSNENIGN